MLKLPKGLKKKKKGKKSKKDKELFTEEELEEYKKQLQQKQQQQQHEDNQQQNEESDTVVSDVEQSQKVATEITSKSEEDDEWQKFKALTAGVDSILHKTQDDLDRIKSTSFFQRVPPPSEKKKQEEEEAAALEAQRLEEEKRRKEEEEANRDKLAEAVVELSESEEESENSDDIFDTAYIDAITSGEVQLAVVPDSPVFEVEEGPDPFDTSYADKLIKGPEVSKRGKKLVSIGSAVEVLTGRVESTQAASGVKRKPRRGIQNLLLDNFDEEVAVVPDSETSLTPEPPKTLLDDPADEIPDVPIDLSVSLHLAFKKDNTENETEGENQENIKQESEKTVDVVSEFDVLKEDEDDEFAELAIESLTKKEEVIVLTQPQPLEFSGEVESNWAEFEQQPEQDAHQNLEQSNKPDKVKPPRPPPARPATGPHISNFEVEFTKAESDEEVVIPEDDPFDTTFVEQVVLKKEEDEDFDFNPRAEELKSASPTLEIKERDLLGGSNPDLSEINHSANLLIEKQRDLLGGSTSDLSTIPQAPILPVQESKDLDIDFDPFDTSTVTNLVQPKETELKFLEKELLTNSPLKHSLSDPDFDPRAEEISKEESVNKPIPTFEVATPDSTFDPARRKSSLSLNLQPKSVAFLVPDKDLLALDNEGSKIQKPLTPYYSTEVIPEKEDTEDPFDTSFVPDSKPTKVELNLLEQDLLANSTLKQSLSDPDFNPRAEDEPLAVPSQEKNPDLLAVENQINIKVLTPAQETCAVANEVKLSFDDPFDTSGIAANILPGKTELKLIENELLPAVKTIETAVLDTQTDAQELGLGDKVLTPQIPITELESSKEVDPFDTSFAENLGPGKTEIKILESELIEN